MKVRKRAKSPTSPIPDPPSRPAARSMPTPLCRRAALLWLGVCAGIASGGAPTTVRPPDLSPAGQPPADQPLVTVETIGEEVAGRLASLDSRGDLRLAENGSRLASGDVLKVVFEAALRPALDSQPLGEVELVDSSRFEYVGVAFEAESIRFELRGGARLAAPVTNIASWRIGRGAGLDAAPTSGASDMLVVKRRDGSFAPVEGVAVAVSEAGVRFALDADDGAEPVDAAWSRIGELRFYRTPERSSHPPRAIVTLTDGGRVAVDDVRYASGQVLWAQGEAPVAAVASIDLSRGRVLAARDLTVADAKWTPYFPVEGEAAPGGMGHAFDESLLGGPLALRFPDRRAPRAWPAVSVRQTYARGVALRSRGELRFDLPAGSRRVRGWVGLDPGAALAGAAEVSVLAGDETLWSGAVDGRTAPTAIDAPVDTATTLTLRVDYGDNLDAGDFVNFCDLRVIR